MQILPCSNSEGGANADRIKQRLEHVLFGLNHALLFYRLSMSRLSVYLGESRSLNLLQ